MRQAGRGSANKNYRCLRASNWIAHSLCSYSLHPVHYRSLHRKFASLPPGSRFCRRRCDSDARSKGRRDKQRYCLTFIAGSATENVELSCQWLCLLKIADNYGRSRRRLSSLQYAAMPDSPVKYEVPPLKIPSSRDVSETTVIPSRTQIIRDSLVPRRRALNATLIEVPADRASILDVGYVQVLSISYPECRSLATCRLCSGIMVRVSPRQSKLRQCSRGPTLSTVAL